jgi:serine/threonine protein kinase/tetratricopeptide (TPR) repeat protein
LTADRKKLIDEIFLNAADLPLDRRQAFLEAACPDAEIAREVNSLLVYDNANSSSLESVVQRAATSFIGADPLVGTHLGPYRITEELGKGGMGAVFLAIRDDETFEKRVAVKVVKRGMDSAAVLDRFHHERRILANLDHPYIAHLLDAGTTPDGRPYFVMEYVEGQPIVSYCASQQLELAGVLELFRKVCDAVSCAHRNLTVHRDLKAGNILVSADGSPKLLDFGIAKLLDPHGQTDQTAPAGRMLTLDCASPEQICGGTVTTSTDIYSLGILLFELLAGRPPWTFKSVSTKEAEEIICHAAAQKPSVALRQSGGTPWVGASPRALTGDLDNIVLMAMRKDPEERYRSVDELSMDLLRHQDGLPVIAREDSVAYRGLKFLRRHWVAAALGAFAVLGLCTGMVYANIERRQAEARLNQMLRMANQTLLDLHTEIEHQPGAMETRLRIIQFTVAYLANLAREAGDNQDVRTTLGTAYLRAGDIQGFPHSPNLGDSSGALASYAEAEKLFSAADHLPLAILLYHRGDVLCQLGRTNEGLAALKESLAHAAKSDSTESQLTAAESYHRIAFVLTQSNPEEALANSRQEMEIYTRLAQREPDNVEVLNGLVSSYSTTGGALNRRYRLEEALPLYRKGVAIRQQLVAKNPHDVALRRDLMISYGRLGDLLGNPTRVNLGDRQGALENFQKARAIAESLGAADPKNQLGRMDLAQIHMRVGLTMDASDQARESLELLDSARAEATYVQNGKELTKDQVWLSAWIDEGRGSRFAALGDSAAAVAAFRHSLEEAQTSVNRDGDDASSWQQLLYACRGLAPQLAALGRRDEALRIANDAIAKAGQLAASGPDTTTMALFVPRTSMWLGATYEALARQSSSQQQRRADWAAAAENYARANDQWHKLSGRKDYSRFQADVSEASKKAIECDHRSKQG